MSAITEPSPPSAPARSAAPAHVFLRQRARWHVAEVVFWLATLLPFWLFPTYLTLASQIAIAGLFAMSLDLILGYAGIVSLGHALFFGFGSYTAGLLARYGWGEPITGLLVAGAASALLGWLTSFIVVRVQGLALIMITMGLGLLGVELANAAGWLTGGANGLQGVDVWPVLGLFDWDLWGYTAYGYALLVLFLCFLAARLIVHSPFGLTLRGIRENRRRMPMIGTDTRARLRRVYVIAAVFAGIAGALLAQTTATVSLATLGFQRSADVMVMLILGGTGGLYGGLLGALIFLVARDQLADMNPQYWYFWIGLLLIAIVMFMPNGILGGLTRLSRRWTTR